MPGRSTATTTAQQAERVVREILIAHGSWGDGSNLDKFARYSKAMKSEFLNASASFKKRNPHLFNAPAAPPTLSGEGPPLRQRTKLPSQAELEFIALLEARHPEHIILHEKIAFRLANGVVYWPDVIVVDLPSLAYEVKGKRRKDAAWARDDSRVKLKVAAGQYPWIQWAMVWKDDSGNWQEQIITE